MRELSINSFKRELSVTYGSETYLVRDNGSICRLQRPNSKKRPLDGTWTLGKQCKTHGYRRSSGLPVHKIVATAFHGQQPSPSHVVDHIDTNRRNNRVENLRWVTRLENIVENPKTFRRIKNKWGSITGMLQDPDRLLKAEPLSNRSWMPQPILESTHHDIDKPSYTRLAVQRNWKTLCAFPLCPDEMTEESLMEYFAQLDHGAVFSHNKFGETLVEAAALSKDSSFISIVTKIIDGVKGWGLAVVTIEAGKFVHTAHGTFFTREGAHKRHFQILGIKWEGADSIDDYC